MRLRGTGVLLVGLGAALALAGCEATEDDEFPYKPGDEFQKPEGEEQDGQQGSQEGSAEGGEANGGTRTGKVEVVEQVEEECYRMEVAYPPQWECTPEQIEEAQTGPYDGPYDGLAGVDIGPFGQPEGPVDLDKEVSLGATDCEGLAELRRPALINSYLATLGQTRLWLLRDRCLEKVSTYWVDGQGNRTAYCGELWGGADAGMDYAAAGSGGSSPAVNSDGSEESSGASEYSTTNNQVAGVEEADFVKNDSGHVYVASRDGLHVIDAWPAPDTHEIAYLPLPGEPRRLFLAGDRLVAYSRMREMQAERDTYADYDYGNDYYGLDECTYGYDCRFSSDGGHTMILVFDVSDPATPKQLVRYELSGSFVAARRVGPYVYTVVHDHGLQGIPGIDLSLDADDPQELDGQCKNLKDEIEQKVKDTPACAFLPWIVEIRGTSSDYTESELEPCDNALAAEMAAGTSFLSLVALDLDALDADAIESGDIEAPSRTLVATNPGFVYASAQALYVAADGLQGGDSAWWYRASAQSDASVIHKFRLDGVQTSYAGGQVIRGHVLNQFSMDEYEGVLRVATSNGWVPDSGVSSNVTTLKEVDGEFVRLGELSGLAPTEDIRSVRFDRERGFVVTFKKTDPLFVIDLSNPAQPDVLGELKIPGFSTYMHYLDESHLLAVGFDADDHGSFAYFDGIQIQIFDVSELSDPQLVHKTVIGTRGSGSEALMNHLAFNYFAPRGLLALPVTVCEGGDNGNYGYKLTFSGLIVFDVSLEDGINELGRMSFVDSGDMTYPDDDTYWDDGCGQWWTNSTSLVKRSIFMDDYAFGLSETVLKVAALSELDSILQSVPLVAAP